MSDFMTRRSVSSAQRGLMPALWKRCPRTAILNGHLDKGWGFIDDFLSADHDTTDDATVFKNWVVNNASAGTLKMTDGRGGWCILDSNSTVADQGAQMQRLDGNGGAVFLPGGSSEIFFECRVRPSDLGSMKTGDGMQLFFGLGNRDTSFFNSGTISATDYVGFKYDADDGDSVWHFVGYDGTEDDNSTSVSISDGSTVKLGFWIYKNRKMVPYINGVALDGYEITASASIPSALMAPTLCCLSEGTVDPLVKIDYVACFQTELLDNPF